MSAATIADVLSGAARWCVVGGDCLDVMATMPDRSVAHVICDPPYDERTHSRARSLKNGGSDIPIEFAALTSFAHVPEMLRVAERWVLAFCSLLHFGKYYDACGDESWIRGGIWDRPDGTPQISGDRPGQAVEGIAVMHRPGKRRWNRSGKRGIWRCGVERVNRIGDHPTPKPIDLMLELMGDFTEPDDVILDPYAGSGTTGVAALRLGRRCILIEKDPKYAALCRERMTAEESSSTLQAKRAGQEPLFFAKETT